jgi:uncharacterized membrane-anchored protein YhcB (DUF1043 family)
MNSVHAEMEETIKHRVDDVLTSVDLQTQGLCKELDSKMEGIQLELQVVTASLDVRTQSLRDVLSARIEETQRDLEMSFGTRTGSLYEEMTDTKRGLREEMADTERDLNDELEARYDIQATKTQVKATGSELRKQLKLVEARSEVGSYWRTRTGA